jgi:molybdopterin converting factor subunit 1
MPKVIVKMFALSREIVGFDEMTINLRDDAATVADLKATLSEQYPALLPVLPFSQVAVNQGVVDDTHVLSNTDEIAILPPFSGG